MSNFLEDIEAAAKGEPIIGIVLSGDYGDDIPESMEPTAPKNMLDRYLPFAIARPWLDREYDTGFGGADCYAIFAWTPTRVLFVDHYDGATSVCAVPRNPEDAKAYMPGGG